MSKAELLRQKKQWLAYPLVRLVMRVMGGGQLYGWRGVPPADTRQGVLFGSREEKGILPGKSPTSARANQILEAGTSDRG